MTFIIWIILCLLVGVYGDSRPLGFGWAFFWALLLSPVLGFIITALYKGNNG